MEKDRSRRWQLTENNADYTKQQCLELLGSIGSTIYVVSCEETGESGTKHVHAFVIYENAISLKSLKKRFPRAHFESCKGSNIENRNYIVKSDSQAVESGTMPIANDSERKTNVASEVVGLLKDGYAVEDIMTEYPELCDYCIRFFRNLKEVQKEFGTYFRKR